MFIQYGKEQQAHGECQVGEPGDRVFLHNKEKSERPVMRCWREKSSVVVGAMVSIMFRDVNQPRLLGFCTRLRCVRIVRT